MSYIDEEKRRRKKPSFWQHNQVLPLKLFYQSRLTESRTTNSSVHRTHTTVDQHTHVSSLSYDETSLEASRSSNRFLIRIGAQPTNFNHMNLYISTSLNLCLLESMLITLCCSLATISFYCNWLVAYKATIFEAFCFLLP